MTGFGDGGFGGWWFGLAGRLLFQRFLTLPITSQHRSPYPLILRSGVPHLPQPGPLPSFVRPCTHPHLRADPPWLPIPQPPEDGQPQGRVGREEAMQVP